MVNAAIAVRRVAPSPAPTQSPSTAPESEVAAVARLVARRGRDGYDAGRARRPHRDYAATPEETPPSRGRHRGVRSQRLADGYAANQTDDLGATC